MLVTAGAWTAAIELRNWNFNKLRFHCDSYDKEGRPLARFQIKWGCLVPRKGCKIHIKRWDISANGKVSCKHIHMTCERWQEFVDSDKDFSQRPEEGLRWFTKHNVIHNKALSTRRYINIRTNVYILAYNSCCVTIKKYVNHIFLGDLHDMTKIKMGYLTAEQ